MPASHLQLGFIGKGLKGAHDGSSLTMLDGFFSFWGSVSSNWYSNISSLVRRYDWNVDILVQHEQTGSDLFVSLIETTPPVAEMNIEFSPQEPSVIPTSSMGTDFLTIHIEGHADVQVPCAIGDWSCQAHYVCNAVTGSECVWQQYDCMTGISGSWFPNDGMSGDSNFNFAYSYDLNGNYGNICACNVSQLSRYGLAATHDSCGAGVWYRDGATGEQDISPVEIETPTPEPTVEQLSWMGINIDPVPLEIPIWGFLFETLPEIQTPTPYQGTWLTIHVEGHPDVQVPCAVGDWSCQAHYVCNAVTESECVWQQYDCVTGASGSWYPDDGISGSSNFNFAYSYDLNGNYGNICACNASQLSRYGIASNHEYCGSGVWYRDGATGSQGDSLAPIQMPTPTLDDLSWMNLIFEQTLTEIPNWGFENLPEVTPSPFAGTTLLSIRIEGHADVQVPCEVGDWSCQAHHVCNAVTGTECVWQQYDCASGISGSWYPNDGSSGGSNFNFAYAYDLNGNYGNICGCNASQFSRYGLASNHEYCGSGVWYRDGGIGEPVPTPSWEPMLEESSTPTSYSETWTSTPTPIGPQTLSEDELSMEEALELIEFVTQAQDAENSIDEDEDSTFSGAAADDADAEIKLTPETAPPPRELTPEVAPLPHLLPEPPLVDKGITQEQLDCITKVAKNFQELPFNSYPKDGCNIRAASLIKEVQKECKLSLYQVWIFAKDQKWMTPCAGVQWGMHTTACYYGGDGKTLFVIDPAYRLEPVEWNNYVSKFCCAAGGVCDTSKCFTEKCEGTGKFYNHEGTLQSPLKESVVEGFSCLFTCWGSLNRGYQSCEKNGTDAACKTTALDSCNQCQSECEKKFGKDVTYYASKTWQPVAKVKAEDCKTKSADGLWCLVTQRTTCEMAVPNAYNLPG